VRALAAGGRAYSATGGSITLPKRTRALSVAYTALSLTVPERVRFRYRLMGLDTAWQDAGPRREAFYTNLGPGAYRFEVTAANHDGVWSVAPATLDVVIPPMFVQTDAFLALCAAAAGGAAWALAVWRHRRAVGAARARYEVMLAERMRVARELHDTLLTDVAGLRMQLDAAARAIGPAGAAASLVAALRDQASQTLVNARRAVVDMRASRDASGPVADQLADAAGRIFADTGVSAHVAHTGTPRRYPSTIEAEVLRVAGEAMANARAHADCRWVRVTCGYEPGALRLEVCDDGRGFDPARAAADGHYGLVGMRERASAIGARLTVESAPGRGTVVRLVVPSTG
jgi:signal transduction histidine kinase